jgi:hypothetical protein
MIDLKKNYQLYRLRLIKTEKDLYEEIVYSDELDALCRMLDDDYHKKRTLVFAHPNNTNEKYKRHYCTQAMNGFAMLEVGRLSHYADCAYVFVNIHPKLTDVPYVVFGEYRQAFRSHKTLARMMERAFNWALNGRGLMVTLEAWNEEEGEEIFPWGIDLMLSMVEAQQRLGEAGRRDSGIEDMELLIEQIGGHGAAAKGKTAKRKPLKSGMFYDYIVHTDKELVLKRLHQVMKGLTIPKDIARPFRYLIDRKVIDRPPYKAVIREFPELESYIHESRYNHYMNENNPCYDHDVRYEKMDCHLRLII